MPVKVTYRNEHSFEGPEFENYFESCRGAFMFIGVLDGRDIEYDVEMDVPWPGGDDQ